MGGEFLLGLRREVREQADVAAGDVVDLQLELDSAPREVELALGERTGEAREDCLGLADQLTPGDTDDPVTRGDELGIPSAVSFEGHAGAVRIEAVDLDDQPALAPERVDLAAEHAHVGLGLG
jgi:hypothetical protein